MPLPFHKLKIENGKLRIHSQLSTTCPELRRRINSQLKVKRGFTLIELLVVIIIISILVAIATVSYTNAQRKGRDSKRKADLKAVQQSLEVYFQTNNKYPASSANGRIQCNVTGDGSVINWGTQFICDENGSSPPSAIIYMQATPTDPTATDQAQQGYYYQAGSSNLSYNLGAILENTNDPERVASGCLNVSGYTNRTYCVIQP